MTNRCPPSDFVCLRCGLQLRRQGGSWKHSANSYNPSCGRVPLPIHRDLYQRQEAGLGLEPGLVFEIWRPGGVITVPGREYRQRFSGASMEARTGQVVPLWLKGRLAGTAKVLSALADDDGHGYTVAYQVMTTEEEAA